jgi:hypothetical protein
MGQGVSGGDNESASCHGPAGHVVPEKCPSPTIAPLLMSGEEQNNSSRLNRDGNNVAFARDRRQVCNSAIKPKKEASKVRRDERKDDIKNQRASVAVARGMPQNASDDARTKGTTMARSDLIFLPGASSDGSSSEPPETRKSGTDARSATPFKLESGGEHAASMAMLHPSESELEGLSNSRAVAGRKTWYIRFRELVSYKEEYGDTKVPQLYEPNQPLANWVHKQRRCRDRLVDKQIQILDEVGFYWGKKKGELAWTQHFVELKEYKKENGHCKCAAD